jgi:hypothetical protein
VALLSGGPVRSLEALEKRTGVSVETDITDALNKTIGVEVLSEYVMLNVWLLSGIYCNRNLQL